MATRFAINGSFGSVSAAQDILRIASPTASVMRLISLHVTNDADETSEMLPFTIFRATGTAGVGTAATIENLETDKNTLISAGAYTKFSAIYDLSTPETQGADLIRESVNILSGFHFVPVPEERPILTNDGRIVCRLETAPTNTLSLSVWAVVEIEG